jgi:hypothetical protein
MLHRNRRILPLILIIASGLFGCVGARPEITFEKAIVPISMSGVVLDSSGLPLTPKDQIPVGRFKAEQTGYAMLYTFLPLNSLDFSDEVNHQVSAVNGDAVVNLEVTLMTSGCSTLNFLQITQAVPIYLGCVTAFLEGDIIQVHPTAKYNCTY